MKYINTLKIGILTLLVGICLSSCGTTPFPEKRQSIAYSGNDETAGILRFNPDGSLQINGDARTRYNSYVQKYGQHLLPPIEADYGITPHEDGFSLTDEAAEKWSEMLQMEKQERINRSK